MKTHVLFVIVVLVIGAACQMAPQELSQAEIAEIHRLEQEFLKAIVASDFDKAVALRTEDLVWMPPGASAVEGRTALHQLLSSSPVRAIGFTANPIRTEGRNGLAYNRGEYFYTGVNGNDTVKETGKYL